MRDDLRFGFVLFGLSLGACGHRGQELPALAPPCGDGELSPGEECDDGPSNADDGACKRDCTLARCGDGLVGPAEGCDDGNAIDSDLCTNACTPATCGDGVPSDTEACDDGNSDDTDGCVSGCALATCGDGWVEVGMETCDDANDVPADGCTECRVPGTERWTRTYDGGAGDDRAEAVAVAPSGEVLVVGRETQDVGGGPRAWMRLLDANGDEVWTVADDSIPSVSAAASDGAGGFVVAGSTWAGLEGTDIWLRRIDADGREVWTRTAGGADGLDDFGAAVAVDEAGDVVVAGFVGTGTMDWDDIWIAKYDADGNPIWSRTVRGSGGGSDHAYAVATDPDHNVVVAGVVDEGEGRAIWVAKLDPDGRDVWARTDAGASWMDDEANGVACDESGGIVVSGFTDMGDATTVDVWVRRYDPNGEGVWTSTHDGGHGGWDRGRAVATDAAGRVFVAGDTESAAGLDGWVGGFDAAGAFAWEQTFTSAGSGFDVATGIAVAGDDVVAVGYVAGADGGNDVWIGRYVR